MAFVIIAIIIVNIVVVVVVVVVELASRHLTRSCRPKEDDLVVHCRLAMCGARQPAIIVHSSAAGWVEGAPRFGLLWGFCRALPYRGALWQIAFLALQIRLVHLMDACGSLGVVGFAIVRALTTNLQRSISLCTWALTP